MALLSHNPENRRQLGERLAAFVCSSSFRASGSNALVGVIADLVADDPDMGPPLKDLVTRPTFQNLLPSAAQGGAGVLAQRDSLLTELNRTYNPDIVAAMGDILNGFLDISEHTNSPQASPNEEAESFADSDSSFAADHQGEDDEEKSDIENLRDLLASKQWHDADRQTWAVLLNSIGSTRSFIGEGEWELIPCDLIREVDILWSEGSSFRYGFSVQKAIWDEIVSQIRGRESHESVEIATTPSRIFYALLRSGEAMHNHFRPGFFPGYGALAQWDSWESEWNFEVSDSGLISSFNLLYTKLQSSGLSFHEIPLDSRTVSAIENLVDSAPYRSLKTTEKSFVAQSNSPVLDPDTGKSGCAGLFLFCLAIATIAGIASIIQESSVSVSQESSAASVEAISEKLDSLQRELNQAVLICEIKPLISQIRSVETTGVAAGIGAAMKRKNTMIANANKRIAFLDAKGEMNYEEFANCSYGRQYFDDSTDPNNPDQLRVFIAVSRKCKNPKLVVKYSLADDQNYIPGLEYTQPITGHITGPISLPYPKDRTYFYDASVTCS